MAVAVNDSFEQMVKEYKTQAQFKQLAEGQHKTIVQLSRKINELQAKLESSPAKPETRQLLGSVEDKEIICRTQLAILREKSLNSELTLEEAKKVEIFTRVLASDTKDNKLEDSEFKQISNEELVALVETSAE